MIPNLPNIPTALIKQCFDITQTASSGYSHILLTIKENAPLNLLQQNLKNFYEIAHADARIKFNDMFGLSLDPLSVIESSVPSYPHSLPADAIKGLFGEVFCALISKSLQIIGHPNWKIVGFLFRYHNVAGEYLYRLGQGEDPGQRITGRTGSDSISVMLDLNNEIISFLVCESKCHQTFSLTVSNDVFTDLSNETTNPVSLGQLKDIIKDSTITNKPNILKSIDDIIFQSKIVNRVDMFLYAFEDPGVITYNPPIRMPSNKPTNYSTTRDLQTIELHFPGMMDFIKHLYASLYTHD